MNRLRTKLLKLLDDWKANFKNERDVHRKAEDWFEAVEWHEYGEDDPRSIVLEVLGQLDSLNYQCIMKDDIDSMVCFLRTPQGNEIDGWAKWRAYWDGVDLEERKKKLANRPYYVAS